MPTSVLKLVPSVQQQLESLITERDDLRQQLTEIEAAIKLCCFTYSDNHGLLVRLSRPEQVLADIARS